MSFLKSTPRASLLDVFKKYPRLARPLHEFAQELMRGPSPFSEGERELIAAYVSARNGCAYCRASHSAVAAKFGVSEQLVGEAVEHVDPAGLPDKLEPVFRYVRKLNEAPARIEQTDIDAVHAAGWDETALVHATLVCAFFNLMNRWVEGLGIEADPAVARMAAEQLHKRGYAAILEFLARQRS